MIVKQIKGKGFYGCLKYVMDKAKATYIDANVRAFDGIREMARDFREHCSINHRVKRVVYHATLSLPPEDKDKLNPMQWENLAHSFLAKMGFFEDPDTPSVPYLIVQHNDRDHDHIHIVAARVRNDGTCVSDSWDYRRGEKAVRELEVEFGLSQPFKQTNRKSPHPYLVEKLERIYHNSDDNLVSTSSEEETPSNPENDPIADQVNQILEYRKQLLNSKKTQDEEETRGNEKDDDSRKTHNNIRDNYSLSSLIARSKLEPSEQVSSSNNTPNSFHPKNPQSHHSPVPTPPSLPILINEVCQQVKTIPEFLKTLKNKGIEATVKLTRNKCVQGIIYHYEGQRISGTQLGAAYTFPGLRKRQKLRFEKHHIPEIEAHNNSCQPLPAPPKWQWLQFVANGFNQWLTQNQKQRYQNDNFEVRRERDWLIISCHNSDFFVKARYDHKKREWLPQSGWRFNQLEADSIRRKLSEVSITKTKQIQRNFRRR